MKPNIKSKYVIVEGVIGVGKTSLCHLLKREFSAYEFLENFELNPFLEKFYQNPEEYAFQTQIFFLLDRYKQQENLQKQIEHILSENKMVVADYMFEKDKIFSELTLNTKEKDIYNTLFDSLQKELVKPDLVIYLDAETDTLIKRIMLRDRSFERNIDFDYIDNLNQKYKEYFQKEKNNPRILTIDSNNLDFVTNKNDFEDILSKIQKQEGLL